MSQHAETVANETASALNSSRLPPEERFWKKYSAHHEFSLSGASSVALHGLLVGLLILGGWLAARLSWDEKRGPLILDPIDVADPGSPGPGNGAGRTEAAQAKRGEAADEHKPPAEPINKLLPPATTLPTVKPEPLNIVAPKFDHADVARLARAADQAGRDLGALLDQHRGIAAAKGEHAKREEQGPGPGDGKPARAGFLKRQERQARWHVTFPADGRSQTEQLQLIHAVVVVPQGQKFLVFKDLRNPRSAKLVDRIDFSEMYWTYTTPKTVVPLMLELGLPSGTSLAVAVFFPKELEDELLREELAHKNLPENRIVETSFALRWVEGRYKPIVTGQKTR